MKKPFTRMNEETLYTLALTRIPGLGLIGAHRLLAAAGSASAIFLHTKELIESMPDFPKRLTHAFDCPDILRLCEAELQFAEKNKIRPLTPADADYPSRLRECDDAPLILFYRGNANLNSLHFISLVGTRHATEYGKGLCLRFMEELKELLPDAVIVSGLAYGIDIHAHRAALQCGFETIGVLAHGLDRIYPSVHRQTAAQMIHQGGLLTEFPSGTNPDRQNFVKRNRIVAGISDATLVIESAAKGGSLITAEIAESYNRDCFAFPGRIGDTYSEGCNNLIKNNRAMLLQSAEELVKAMNWDASHTTPRTVQRQLFPDFTPEEEQVVGLLNKHPEGLQINLLVVQSNIPINRMTGILFELEMKGVIRALAGGVYCLI